MSHRKSTHIHRIFRMISGAAVFLLIGIFCTLSAFAAPKVKEISYEGRGKVEVEFYKKVKYKNPKITVKDASGKSFAAKIVDLDSDDLEFKISGVREGTVYRFTIRGIRGASEKNYSNISGKIYIPKTSDLPKVKKIKYDRKDREVSFDFAGAVQWQKVKVTISGVRYVGGTKYRTVKGTFVA